MAVQARRAPVRQGRLSMLGWALMFLVIGLIAAVLGFTTIAGTSFAIAKFLAVVFLVVFVILLVMGRSAYKKVTS
jgi:uncharacterized membrane protein YtjA (UPF0391 family)